MESTDFAYLAGIVDGEGYFVAQGNTHSFGVRVAVIDECLVDWLHGKFGGYKMRGGTTASGNQIHVWLLQKQEPLLGVLHGLVPFLVIKRRQAEAMVALIEHLRNPPSKGLRPQKFLSPQQRIREGRREKRAAWTARSRELRVAVREARYG